MDGAVDYVAPYTDYMDGVFSYGVYYQRLYAFQNPGGSMATLTTTYNAMAAASKDMSLLGTFLDNHDQPRVPTRLGHDSPEHRAASANAPARPPHPHRGTPHSYQDYCLALTNPPFTQTWTHPDGRYTAYNRQPSCRPPDPLLPLAWSALILPPHARSHAGALFISFPITRPRAWAPV